MAKPKQNLTIDDQEVVLSEDVPSENDQAKSAIPKLFIEAVEQWGSDPIWWNEEIRQSYDDWKKSGNVPVIRMDEHLFSKASRG